VQVDALDEQISSATAGIEEREAALDEAMQHAGGDINDAVEVALL
jgi:hypothetical protein